MEKISHIVHSNARVASTDLKASSAVRPGAPSFGRPMGESPAFNDRVETTAERAIATQNELNESKRGGKDHVVQQMADNFFMSRVRGSEPQVAESHPSEAKSEGPARPEASSTDELVLGDTRNAEISAPAGFKPRGSFVDVHG